MRLGVLDVGSNSIKLQIVDAGPGQPPLPVRAFTTAVKLAERGTPTGEIGDRSVDRLIRAISDALAVAEQQDVGELLCFATEAIRSAPNQELVCQPGSCHQAKGNRGSQLPMRGLPKCCHTLP